MRVYDTSGPWGDPEFTGAVETGLPALRREWILKRGDVAPYEGRTVHPRDNGFLSEAHAGHAAARGATPVFRATGVQPLRASAGHPVTQYWYARQGIVTPEMEYIAIRENQGLELLREQHSANGGRHLLSHQHAGTDGRADAPEIFRRFPQRLPRAITAGIRPRRNRRRPRHHSRRISIIPSSSR